MWNEANLKLLRKRQEDANERSAMLSLDTGTETKVQQHYADEVDINTIVRRFGISQAAPLGIPGGLFGDFTGITDFADAVDRVERAELAFMELPADIRDRFDNDPGKLIAFAQTIPEGKSLNEELGFVQKREEAPGAPPPAPPVA